MKKKTYIKFMIYVKKKSTTIILVCVATSIKASLDANI